MITFFKQMDKGDVVAIIIAIIIVTFLFFYGRERTNALDREPVFTKGIIVGESKGSKGSNFIDFIFRANKTNYKISYPYGFCTDCKSKCCATGDSVIVRYQKSDPENVQLLHELPKDAVLEYN